MIEDSQTWLLLRNVDSLTWNEIDKRKGVKP